MSTSIIKKPAKGKIVTGTTTQSYYTWFDDSVKTDSIVVASLFYTGSTGLQPYILNIQINQDRQLVAYVRNGDGSTLTDGTKLCISYVVF